MKKITVKNILRVFMLAVSMLFLASCATTHEAYKRTSVGEVMLKKIPKLKAYSTSSEESYFRVQDDLFKRLHKYQQYNDLTMSIPVVVQNKPATMMFYVLKDDLDRDLKGMNGVKIVETREMLVLSAGVRGAYREETYAKGKKMIQDWLKENPDYKAVGDYFYTCWNSPCWCPYWQKSEVNLEVKRR